MAPKLKRRKESPPVPGSTASKYPLFASSKRGKMDKVHWPKSSLKREAGQSQARLTNSQMSVIISDSESEDKEGKRPTVKECEKRQLSAENPPLLPPSLPSDRSLNSVLPQYVRGHVSKSMSPLPDATTKRSGNTARCSRGKRPAKLRTDNSRKIASFKPLQKGVQDNTTNSNKIKDKATVAGTSPPVEQEVGEQATMQSTIDSIDAESLDEPLVKHTEQVAAEQIEAERDVESDEEEFHELPEFGWEKQTTGNADKGGGSGSKVNEDLRGKPPSGDADTSSRPHSMSTVLREEIYAQHVSKQPAASPLGTSFVSRQEFDRQMKDLRREMIEEMNKFKDDMHIETKRLIRSEVREEVALFQKE